jgi:hypothetical protein
MKIIELILLDWISIIVIFWAYIILWLDNYYAQILNDTDYLIRTGMILLIMITLYFNITLNLGKI